MSAPFDPRRALVERIFRVDSAAVVMSERLVENDPLVMRWSIGGSYTSVIEFVEQGAGLFFIPRFPIDRAFGWNELVLEMMDQFDAATDGWFWPSLDEHSVAPLGRYLRSRLAEFRESRRRPDVEST